MRSIPMNTEVDPKESLDNRFTGMFKEDIKVFCSQKNFENLQLDKF